MTGRPPNRLITRESGHGKPALPVDMLTADPATPADFAAVRERLTSDEARFWFDLYAPKAKHLAVLDLAAFVAWADAEGNREIWARKVAEARTAGEHIITQYVVPHVPKGKQAQALGPIALQKRAGADADALAAQLGFTPAARTKIRFERQMDLFGALGEGGEAPPENAAASRLDALRGKFGIVNGGLATG